LHANNQAQTSTTALSTAAENIAPSSAHNASISAASKPKKHAQWIDEWRSTEALASAAKNTAMPVIHRNPIDTPSTPSAASIPKPRERIARSTN
jgi:hypothetical protein